MKMHAPKNDKIQRFKRCIPPYKTWKEIEHFLYDKATISILLAAVPSSCRSLSFSPTWLHSITFECAERFLCMVHAVTFGLKVW